MKTISCISILALIFCAMASAQPQEDGRLHYSNLCRLVSWQMKGVSGFTNREVRLTIKSKLPGVKPTDIHPYIGARSGRIPLPLNSDGTFSLPISENLMKEDPIIEVNQPKGTMEFSMNIAFTGNEPVIETGDRQHYNTLFYMEDVRNRLAESDFGTLPISNAIARAEVVARLVPRKDAATAAVVIETARGPILLPRDKDGTFHIQRDPQLAKENPWVFMPTNHHWDIMSYMREKGKAEDSK